VSHKSVPDLFSIILQSMHLHKDKHLFIEYYIGMQHIILCLGNLIVKPLGGIWPWNKTLGGGF